MHGYIHTMADTGERDTISNSTVTETGESNPKQVFRERERGRHQEIQRE